MPRVDLKEELEARIKRDYESEVKNYKIEIGVLKREVEEERENNGVIIK
jgi:hypothetical protein